MCLLSPHSPFACSVAQIFHTPATNPLNKTKQKTKALITCFVSNIGGRAQQKSGPVVLDEVKNPAMEKLELVRKWSLNTYKVCGLKFVCRYIF